MLILITRPRYDKATHYLYHWSQTLVDEAKKANHQVFDLEKNYASRKKVISYLKKQSPKVVLFNGHGSTSEMFGHEGDVLIAINKDEKLLEGKYVYMRACSAGALLSPKLISKGTKGFIGYINPYTFFQNNDFFNKPLKDKWATPFLSTSNQVARSLIKGHTVREAHESSLKEYSRQISKLLTSESKDSFLLPHLLMNKNSQVCLES